MTQLRTFRPPFPRPNFRRSFMSASHAVDPDCLWT